MSLFSFRESSAPNEKAQPPAGFDLRPLQTRTDLAQNSLLTPRHRRVVLYAGLGGVLVSTFMGKILAFSIYDTIFQL